jgi:general secretion pathway protein D
MKTVRVFILAVLFSCLAVGYSFAVKMVEDRTPTQAAPPDMKARAGGEKQAGEQTAEKPETLETSKKKPRNTKQVSATEETATKTSKSAQYVTMDFDGVDITMMIKFIADLTKKNFIVGDNVSGKVTVISPRKMSIDEAYKVFESVLEVNGFSTIPMNGVIKIVKSSDAMTKGIETKMGATVSKVDKLVTQIIPLKFADAEDMKNLLTPLISRGASLILSYPQSNIIILTDSLSNIKKVLDIIKILDVAGFAQDVKIIHLAYASASDLAAKLNQILTGGAGEAGARAMARRMPGGVAGKEAPKIIPYERTNALIVMASSQDMKEIEDLVQQLDIPTPSGKEDIHVYYLQHASAEEVAKVLSGIPAPTSPEATPAPGTPAVARTTTTTQQQNFKISPDKATNSLIIFADPYTYNNVVETIKYLDIPRKQVYVKAFIMEVKTNKDFKFGVEWTAFEDFKYDHGEKIGGVLARTGTSFVTSPADLPAGPLLGVIGQAITINKGGAEITFPNMTSFINAMAKDTDVNVISTPQIITMDNKQAEIKVGANIPYITKEDTDATNINRTVRTYDYRDVGVTLKLTPQINQHGNVRMEIFQEITTLVPGQGAGEFAPTTLKRSATTTVTVKDGTTMVIGGLIGETLTMGNTRVPGLGSIPILGYLFKTVSRNREKTNLYIFLTPAIIDTEEKAGALYREKYGEVKYIEKIFDKDKKKKDKSAPSEGKDVKPEEGKSQMKPAEEKPEAKPQTPNPEEKAGEQQTGNPASDLKTDMSAPVANPGDKPQVSTPAAKTGEVKGDENPQP